MKEYKCYGCGKIFKAKGRFRKFTDAIYGPCSKWVAICPACGEEAVVHTNNPAKLKRSGGAPCGKYDSCSCCGG